MKSKQVLIVVLLSAIPSIGITWWCVQSQYAKLRVEIEAIERFNRLPPPLQNLVDVKEVYVRVHALQQDAEPAGLNEEQLQEDVEFRLRLAGIKLCSGQEWHAYKGIAFFQVIIDTASAYDSPNMAFHVSVELSQDVQLDKYRFTPVNATMWHDSKVGMSLNTDFPERVRQDVKELMDKFLFDYLKANPKK